MIINYLQANWVEIVGVILSLIYIYLSIRQKVSLWLFGFLSSVLYSIVFFNTKFYADMSLQFYYVVISIYGWINWKRGRIDTEGDLQSTSISKRLIIQLGLISVLIYIVYYLILTRFTDSTIPRADSLVGTLSVIGTWMLARKLIENWLVWIFADAIATVLFVYKELYPTAILFTIYTVLAFVGYRQWNKTIIIKE